MAIFDLHVHTVKGSSDSSLSPEELIIEAKRIGLDGVCLTEHGGGWEERDVCQIFEDSGLVVIPGLEVNTEMGHILVFGISSYSKGINRVAELRKAVDEVGGYMVSAHPFRNVFNEPPYNFNLLFKDKNGDSFGPEEGALHPIFDTVDAIEVANGGNTQEENEIALHVSQLRGMLGTGGSDAHSTHGLGSCVTVFDGEVRSKADFMEALKSGAYEPGVGFNTDTLKILT